MLYKKMTTMKVNIKDYKSYSMIFEGIYFDNTNLFIPWDTDFDNVKNFGSPKYSKSFNQSNSDIYEQYLWKDIEFLGIQLSTFGIGRTIKDTSCRLLDSFHGWVKGLVFHSDNLINEFNDSIETFARENQILITSKVGLSSGIWTVKNIELSLFENERLQEFEFKVGRIK
jgi:hypothetical protein